MGQQVEIVGTNGIKTAFNKAEVDEITPSLTSIDVPHNRVHVGDMYSVCHLFTSVGAAASVDLLIRVGANKDLHFLFSVSAGAEAYVRFYEEPTITTNGTAITIFNMNRCSSNTSDATAYHTPTLGAVGNQICVDLIPGAIKNKDVGGTIRHDTEWILDENKDYVIRVTNNGQSAEPVAIQCEWYEV